MYPTTLVTLAALLCSSDVVHGGKVLVVPVDGSHWLNMKVIIEELHSRGHEITVVLPSDSWYIKPDSPYYKSIVTNTSVGFNEKEMLSFTTTHLKMNYEGLTLPLLIHVINKISVWHESHLKMVEEVFENTTLMQDLHDAKYDLLLTDPSYGAGVMLAHRLGLPLVFDLFWTVWGDPHSMIAPSPLSFVPVSHQKLTDKMTFAQRVKNFLSYLCRYFVLQYTADSNYQPFVQRYFGSDVHYSELFQAAEIWLMRTNFFLEFPRPTMPNIVYVSQFHCKPSKPLTKELEDFVHSSGEHGIIFMSLGTLVAELPEDLSEDIAAAFAQLPQKVIWKYRGKPPSTLGNNTLLLDWVPQNDLLGHPKTRMFVTHGGIHGIQEAIYHGVPIVGLPITFDQPDNLFKMEARGVAKTLEFKTLKKDNFLDALQEVLYDPSYREKMKILSNLSRDQPTKPLDHAIFWIEFVMRHKGAPHLKSESYKMSIIQYYIVDVVIFLLAVSSMIITVSILSLKCLWSRAFHTGKMKKE